MTEDITTQILIQIRQDIAEVRNEVAEVEQIASITAILGHFAPSDDRLEIRIAALERHVGISPSG